MLRNQLLTHLPIALVCDARYLYFLASHGGVAGVGGNLGDVTESCKEKITVSSTFPLKQEKKTMLNDRSDVISKAQHGVSQAAHITGITKTTQS